jgi:hypothetical protein
LAGKIPLARPALPAAIERVEWPEVIAVVFGANARAFAQRIADRARASISCALVHAELRQREGFAIEGDGDLEIVSHPDALAAALREARVRTKTRVIGVGSGFAASVEAPLSIWISGGVSLSSLSPAERALAQSARLILEEARPGTADALADRLVG